MTTTNINNLQFGGYSRGMQPITIRPATTSDLPAITAIYNHAVVHSTATFDTNPKTEAEQVAWFRAHDGRHPILVAALDEKVIGWAALSSWSDRCAYNDAAEVSIYIDPGFHGKGVGKQLMSAIDQEAQRARLHTLIARIAEGNPASIHLCESVGFVRIGCMKEVGFKFGRRLDVHMLQKLYGDQRFV